jgi:hypothetical protein
MKSVQLELIIRFADLVAEAIRLSRVVTRRAVNRNTKTLKLVVVEAVSSQYLQRLKRRFSWRYTSCKVKGDGLPVIGPLLTDGV